MMRRIALGAALVALLATPAAADINHDDDVRIGGSACIGFNCVLNMNFGSDTLVLHEDNVRLLFQDNSTTGSFPTTDWRITINDSANGGSNYFGVDDVTAGRSSIFRIDGGAPSNALRVDAQGDIGIGQASPVVELHMTDGDTPTVRLEQDGSSGFTAQTWDVAGNESNFFVRDVTGGSQLPFRIFPGADDSALTVNANSRIGFGTVSPAMHLHAIAADTPGLRMEQADGTTWDIGGNESNFFVRDATAGNRLPFRVRLGAPTNALVVDSDGELGMGTAAPMGALHVTSDTFYDAANSTRGMLVLENTDTSDTYMINAVNDGAVMNIYRDLAAGSTWVETFGNAPTLGRNAYTLAEAGTGTTALVLFGNGNLRIAGTLSTGSSRSIKEGIQPVDADAMLRRLDAMPVANWRYVGETSTHIGPMAEDFHAAFGLGADDAHIAPSDVAGVALASVKALASKLSERSKALEADNAALRVRLEALERALEVAKNHGGER